jgi:hypothetical protein
MFKKIETKIKNEGLKLIHQSDTVIQYEITCTQFNYVQGIDIIRKTGRVPIIQSYQKFPKNDDKFDIMVGLDIYKIKLLLKLIKKLKWI